MILIVGGAASGKKTHALSLGYAPEDIAEGVIDERPVVCDAHLVVAQMLDAQGDDAPSPTQPEFLGELLEQLAAKEVVTCDELGSGVIPLTARDRKLREAVGALTSQLARRADTVIRMTCGLPLVIKGGAR